MAVSRSDIQRWRRDAADAAPSGLSAQLAWLKTKRAEYSAKVQAGDWVVTAESTDGSSTQGARGVSDRDNHDAILAAIEQIEQSLGTGGTGRGTMLGFRIRNITG